MSAGRQQPPLAGAARWDGADLVLAVRVIPRAASDSVVPEADCLKVRLTAPPVEGKANQQLCVLLARLFGVPKSRVTIDKGAGGRTKRVRVVAPGRLPDFLLEGSGAG